MVESLLFSELDDDRSELVGRVDQRLRAGDPGALVRLLDLLVEHLVLVGQLLHPLVEVCESVDVLLSEALGQFSHDLLLFG